ncbi:MAG: hypothetical protein WBZ24_10800 [Anaerolineales bacterium]
MATTNAQRPARKRSWIWWAAGGCVLLLLLTCAIAAAVGGYFYLKGNRASADQPTVEYILDSSPRMALATQGSSRIEVARGVMAEIVRPANPDLTSGLRVFGNGALPQPCQDTQLIVPFAQSNQDQIANQLGDVTVGANSDAALAEATIAAIKDLAATGGPHSLVVVTGGADACNPQAGELIAQEADRAGIDLKTYVVGYQVPADEADALKTQVGAIPGASLQTAEDEAGLRKVLTAIQAEVDATAQSGGQATGKTACDHPYFPLRPGASWSYGGPVPFTWQVDSVSGNQQSASATISIDFSDGSFSTEWQCSPSGILYTEMSGLAGAGIPGGIDLKLVSTSGVTLPSTSMLTSGASWNSSYTMGLGIDVPGFSGSYGMQTSESHQAGSPQSLTTDLGTFDVVPVTSSGTLSMTGLTDFNTDFTSTIWYAKGVGVVRIESSGAGESAVLDLQSYNIP